MSISESTAERYTLADPDVRLMLQVRDDDAQAFEELMLRYQNRVLSLLAHLVGGRDLAEDLTQEVFLRVYRARKRYVPGAKFSTWLFTIAGNVASNALRTKSRRKEVHLAPRASDSAPQSLEAVALAASGLMPTRQLDKAELCARGAAGGWLAQRPAADGRAAGEVRTHELRRYRHRDGHVAAGREVAVVAGPGELARGAAAVFGSRRTDYWCASRFNERESRVADRNNLKSGQALA